MANITDWLIDAEKEIGEQIVAVVVGKHYDVPWAAPPLPDEHVILDRNTALMKLDKEFDDSYGGADCHPIFAWTENVIIVISEYDGSTHLNIIPRNPMACEPFFL
jgi:hypothetical protein